MRENIRDMHFSHMMVVCWASGFVQFRARVKGVGNLTTSRQDVPYHSNTAHKGVFVYYKQWTQIMQTFVKATAAAQRDRGDSAHRLVAEILTKGP